VASRAHAAVRVLAELQALDVGRLAEPPSSLLEELTRWQRAFATTDGPHTEPAAELGRLLGRRVPAAAVPALVHGDFRLGNLLYEGSRVRAVLDWEIWSVGDPRLDLAWFVARASNGHPARPEDRHGFPSAAALLDTYAANPPDDFGWFLALAAFKHAAAAALLDKRGRPDDRHQPERVVDLLRWAGTQLAAAR
jgi:aminoglycoside phosphotransferase (APT) family kinase protein